MSSYKHEGLPTQGVSIAMPRQHQSKSVKKVFAELKRLGFTVEQKRSGTYRIVPPSTIQGPVYSTHGTESALHPMKRDFKKYYNIQLTV
jgi:biotin operon repressor